MYICIYIYIFVYIYIYIYQSDRDRCLKPDLRRYADTPIRFFRASRPVLRRYADTLFSSCCAQFCADTPIRRFQVVAPSFAPIRRYGLCLH